MTIVSMGGGAASATGAESADVGRDGAVAVSAPERWLDRLLDRRDTLLASAGFRRWAARFPLTRPIARQRSRQLFDLCAGFVYSQVLRACVELDLFEQLRSAPQTPAQLAAALGLPLEATERLLGAAVALRLLERRTRGRVGLGALGAPLAENEALQALVAHHALLYDDLREPLALLRRPRDRRTALARYYPYAAPGTAGGPQSDEAAEPGPGHDVAYSRLMSATSGPLLEEVIDAYPFASHHVLLDVGGGEGRFARGVAARWPHLAATVFDLPPVAARARADAVAAGLGDRVSSVGGDFRVDPLPSGADVATLVRVLLDHDDATVLALLGAIRRALAPGGRLLIVEPMAGLRGARTVGDAYFALYLFAMGGGRARGEAELIALCRAAGFAAVRRLTTHYPVSTGILVASV